LYEKGFEEVETPILSTQFGGAIAEPFQTFSKALDSKLYMRIAPELYLKKLVVGGYDKVFEIGKQFRNEGIDSTHNPEFTTCELYQSYINLEDLFSFTENILRELVIASCGSACLQRDYKGNSIEIDFSRPFSRVF
jgi:lysyl-tRNA synthetase class 2